MRHKRLSSKTVIKLHALFQFALAVYLTRTQEIVGGGGEDDDATAAALMRYGGGWRGQEGGHEHLGMQSHQHHHPLSLLSFSRPRSPFAYCGIMLVFFALFDLILAIKLPALNQLLTITRLLYSSTMGTAGEADTGSGTTGDPFSSQSPPQSPSRTLAAAVSKAIAAFASLFTHICVLLGFTRLVVFAMVALRIYASPAEEWRGMMMVRGGGGGAGSAGAGGGSAEEQVKSKVILGYGLAEMMFSKWILQTLMEERKETVKSILSVRARILRR